MQTVCVVIWIYYRIARQFEVICSTFLRIPKTIDLDYSYIFLGILEYVNIWNFPNNRQQLRINYQIPLIRSDENKSPKSTLLDACLG